MSNDTTNETCGHTDNVDTDKWEDMTKTHAVSDVRHVQYIPNPSLGIIDMAEQSITPIRIKADDILPVEESHDWESIASYNYIHMVSLHGVFKHRYLNNPTVAGYKCSKEPPDGKFFIHNRYYRGAWGFRIKVKEETWLDRSTKERRSKLVGNVTLYPKFRASLWETVQWAEELLRQIEMTYCIQLEY